MNETPALTIKNMYFSYDAETVADKKYALSDINLDIYKGTFTAVLGHNGSGKSTLAKLMNMILVPTAGKVYVGDLDATDENNLLAVRQRVGMVFQNPDNQIVSTIIEEDVAFGPENLGIPPAEIRRRVEDALATVGMSEYRMHSPHMLSGGQKQRIAIAGVIAMTPEIIIFDESTAMLDPKGRDEVLSTIRELNRERGMTVLLITHYMSEAVLADRVIVLDKGRITLDGTPKHVFSQYDRIKAAGLDVPQVTELMRALEAEKSEEGREYMKRFSFPSDILRTAEAADILSAQLERKVSKENS